MELTADKNRMIEKMFEAALKEKVNQLARKYDYGLVFELWTRLAKTNCIKAYFGRWRWKPDMTITEGMECLDDYFARLEFLLKRRQAAGDTRQ